ncbi:hypothetical protein F5148DRAFT_1280156 [Russula earlei]|uniref:Uncharacterized protein n=1 Tax=Russula earlei TaxID=71964 RepID=A0ACC0ULY1_9AGAM|nr:hypothetical protein F5148DRAFT_1280156 [Russula earlei]
MAVEPGLDLHALATLEAALVAMREDIDTPFVPQRAFVAAAKALKRQITPELLQKFDRGRDDFGVTAVA